MKKYFKIWWMMASLTSQVTLRSTFGAIIFFIAKFLRLGLFIVFLVLLESNTKGIGGYSIWQMILFFATFNLIDGLPQCLYREVYRFRSYVVKGDFDYILIRPFSPLFRSLFGGSDILDLPVLVLSIFLLVFAAAHIDNFKAANLILFIVLVINGIIIASAFHIMTLAVAVMTTEIDSTIMLYRDLTAMGRIPVDIYLEPVRSFITFVIPIGVMLTFPPKALLGLLSPGLIAFSFMLAIIYLLLSLYFWNYSLKKYSSASS